MIKFIYTIFLGIFVATFVGVGISAFYQEPKYPEPPLVIKYCSPEMTKDAEKYKEFQKVAEKYDKEQQAFQKTISTYNRNVSIISLIAAIILVIVSLTFLRKIYLIADGLLLGGVLTLLYSIIRGFGTDDNMFRFIVVSIGLLISLILGYYKFIKSKKT